MARAGMMRCSLPALFEAARVVRKNRSAPHHPRIKTFIGPASRATRRMDRRGVRNNPAITGASAVGRRTTRNSSGATKWDSVGLVKVLNRLNQGHRLGWKKLSVAATNSLPSRVAVNSGWPTISQRISRTHSTRSIEAARALMP